MTLINTNVVAYKKGKGIASGCCPSLKNAAESCTYVATKIFCLEYLGRRSEKVDGHFANCRFLLHFVSQTTVSPS